MQVKARINRVQPRKAPDHQTGAGEQHDGKGDFDHHQRREAAGHPGCRAALGVQCSGQIDFGRLPGRPQPENNAGNQGERHRK